MDQSDLFMYPPPLAMHWFAKGERKIPQLAKFIKEFAKNYARLAENTKSPGEALFRLIEAYQSTRRPNLSKLVLGKASVSSKLPSVGGVSVFNAAMRPLAMPTSAQRIKDKRIAPVSNIVINSDLVRNADIFKNIESLAHEQMHGSQHWRKSRPFDSSSIPAAPWYIPVNPDGSRNVPTFKDYWNNPYEVQARRAGSVAKSDFSRFIDAVIESLGSPDTPPDLKSALSSIFDVLFQRPPYLRKNENVLRDLGNFIEYGRPGPRGAVK